MKIYPLFIPHAGCPKRCLFCAQDRSTTSAAVPDVDTVNEWLEKTLPLHGDGEIAFYGGTFSLLPLAQQEDYLTVAGQFIASGRVAGIRISTRPDALEEDCLLRLKTFGVTTIEIGCQSFNNAVLHTAGRGHSATDNISAIQRCRKAGFQVGVQLMPGLPGGNVAEAIMSLQQTLALKPSFVRIYPTVVIDDTELANLWRRGDYKPWQLDETVELCADMLHLCRQTGIPVVRLGLQHDPQLEENLLAGPYHPAFGQLVRSRLWRRALLYAGSKGRPLTVHPNDLSDAVGHHGENRALLEKSCPAVYLETDSAVKRGCLRVSGQDLPFIDLSARGGSYG